MVTEIPEGASAAFEETAVKNARAGHPRCESPAQNDETEHYVFLTAGAGRPVSAGTTASRAA